jgi:hypothetical protein
MRAQFSHAPRVLWFNAWTSELDAALTALPAPAGCSRDHYRVLTEPTGVAKRHALVLDNEAPIAVVSLRKRNRYWEPVTYQCLPGVIAPAIDSSALGRAINALGVEVRVGGGLGPEVQELNPRIAFHYEAHRVDLRGDYQAYWRKRRQRHLWAVRRARSKCEHGTQRLDGESDLDWAVDMWSRNWANDPENEIVVARDRRNFWNAISSVEPSENAWTPHVLQLSLDGRRAAAAVLLCQGDTVTFQCTARDLAFDEFSAGTRVLDLAIEWAAEQGFSWFDLGGGGSNKHHWGPRCGLRYGAIFRTTFFDRLYRIAPE